MIPKLPWGLREVPQLNEGQFSVYKFDADNSTVTQVIIALSSALPIGICIIV